MVQRIPIEPGQQRLRFEEPGDVAVEVHQRDGLHVGIPEDFADRQSIAAPEHEHRTGLGQLGQSRMHQCLVIAVFVARAELQVAVEVQSQVRAVAGEHDALVGRRLGVDDRIGVGRAFRPRHEAFRGDESHQQSPQQEESAHRKEAALRSARDEQPGAHEPHDHIEHAEEEAGAHQPQVRHQDQGKEQRGQQRSDVVEGENPGDEILEFDAVFEQAQEQGDFQPDEHAHEEDEPVQRHPEGRDDREEQE